ncbi:hypothetical protein C0581_01335 [Candidatus Parcubacteria bacterium]|nr:MAG: hypothetical protein C0581_01335 [Candidatus Parcubacteria bacterium]
MLEIIWNDFLYKPLFNGLIWLYNNWADQNLGWAIVYLTIGLRLFLLPFTIIGERNKIKNIGVMDEMKRIDKEYHNDEVLKKEELRKVIKKRKIKPWTTIVTLGVQLLVLVLLYQVFIQGITGERILKVLYDWINFPGSINTMFFGFDLGTTHDIVWSGAVGLFLLFEIYLDYKDRKPVLSQADLFYFILFPLASFLVLWWLPMVKSLFILTSLIFSAIVHQFIKLLFRPAKAAKKA